MNFYNITFSDGNIIQTGFNGSLEEAENYYIGTRFQFGDTDEKPYDLMVEAVKVEVQS
jgi:hypothetical protein